MGVTTKGIPYPEDADKVAQGAQAMKAIATDLDYTKVAQLDPTKVVASSLLTSYPLGISSIVLSTANSAAGGWPSGASAQVWTYSSASDRGVQFFYRNSINDGGQIIFYRVIATSGNGPWVQLPTAPHAAGRAAVVFANVTAQYVAVTFPAGRFTTVPQVVPSVTDSSVYIPSTSSITVTGFNLWLRHYAASSTSGTINCPWVAIGTG